MRDIFVIFAERGIDRIGVCAFEDVLPLLDVRSAGRLPASPKSVIVCALPCFSGDYPGRNVARYAICDDYHKAGGALLAGICDDLRVLHPKSAFEPFIDVSPIREVEAARLAGLGAVGRHGLLILSGYGSYTCIGCVVTDLQIPPSTSAIGGCLDCGECVKSCPTGALGQKLLRKELCRSYITQKRGRLSAWEENQIRAGKMAVGCDICQQACPLNREATITPLARMRENPIPNLNKDNLPQALKNKTYGYLGRKVLERNMTIVDG
ncbi:MAG: hypothetical protein FWE32_06215 [Oscillospiraceae bacterium]|nr:hypothetical protein [Oscillospiraceae bacterium]